MKEQQNRTSRINEQVPLAEIWTELARRLNIRFGKIQVSIHDGKPAKYANIDIRVNTDSELESSPKHS